MNNNGEQIRNNEERNLLNKVMKREYKKEERLIKLKEKF